MSRSGSSTRSPRVWDSPFVAQATLDMGDGLVTSRSVLRGSVDLERGDEAAAGEDAKVRFGIECCWFLIGSRRPG